MFGIELNTSDNCLKWFILHNANIKPLEVLQTLMIYAMVFMHSFLGLTVSASPWLRRRRGVKLCWQQDVYRWRAPSSSAEWVCFCRCKALMTWPAAFYDPSLNQAYLLMRCKSVFSRSVNINYPSVSISARKAEKMVTLFFSFVLKDSWSARSWRNLECCTNRDYCNRDLHPTLPPLVTSGSFIHILSNSK